MEKTILVVDDEPDIMETLGLRLQRAGYHMISASGGEEALRKVAALHPDLIVLDLMMPSPDGMKVCQIIKSNPDFRNIPVILLSARSPEDNQEACRISGADAYVSKPYSAEELLDEIRRLLKLRN